LEKTLLEGFQQMRSENVPISRPHLMPEDNWHCTLRKNRQFQSLK
jgi:hypothetical protein